MARNKRTSWSTPRAGTGAAKRAGQGGAKRAKGNGAATTKQRGSTKQPPRRPKPPSTEDASGSGHRRRRWPRRLLKWTLFGIYYLVLLAVGMAGGLIYAGLDELPNIADSAELAQHRGVIMARDGKTQLRTLEATTSRRYVAYRQLPPSLVNATIAAEDRRFMDHQGVDVRGVARAAWADVRSRSLEQGGSTITQQFVKNAYLGPERTMARKTREAVLAVLVDRQWSKEKILSSYLNTAYYGAGTYGVADASLAYFGKKEPRNLTIAESAMLAGLLRAPELDTPANDPSRATTSRNIVLDTMLELELITADQHATAIAVPVPTDLQARDDASNEIAPHFTDQVVANLAEQYGTARALSSGMQVTTTIDPAMQLAANKAVQRIAGTGLSAALVSLDPVTGEVRAMSMGGVGRKQAFNIATQGRRQPGSTFKVFSMLAALESDYTTETEVESAPYEKELDTGEIYKVKTAGGIYAGDMTLREAMWASDNTVFARVADDMGIDKVIKYAQRAGIRSPISNNPAAALGGMEYGVTPMEMAMAYATIRNHGVQRAGAGGQPLLVTSIKGRGDKTINEPALVKQRAFSRAAADSTTDVLRGVVASGTGRNAAFGMPAAGKTGTTESYADAWFVGYSPYLVTAVWVGHHDSNKPMSTEYFGGPVGGGSFPALIFRDFMQDAHEGRDFRNFKLDVQTTVDVYVDPESGLLAGPWCKKRKLESFRIGNEPRVMVEECNERKSRPVPDVIGMTEKQALKKLDDEEFIYEVEYVIAPADQLDRVIKATPEPGFSVRKNKPIVLQIGTDSVFEGDLTDEEQALDELDELDESGGDAPAGDDTSANDGGDGADADAVDGDAEQQTADGDNGGGADGGESDAASDDSITKPGDFGPIS